MAQQDIARLGQRIALVSVAVGVLLSMVKIFVGLASGSAAVVSDGVEAAADVVSSIVVLAGLALAQRPPDANHPYGHGRYETLASLLVGALLLVTGITIFWHSFSVLGDGGSIAWFAVIPLAAAFVIKLVLAFAKFRIGRTLSSAALESDAWHEVTDLLSTAVASIAVGLALLDPVRLHAADHIGGMLIGIIIVIMACRLVLRTVDLLVDKMPGDDMMRQIRAAALSVPGAEGIEKCFARKTGLQYHVDLHLEVDPGMTVRESHEIATQVRFRIKERLTWVADVLVHVEPSPRPRDESSEHKYQAAPQ